MLLIKKINLFNHVSGLSRSLKIACGSVSKVIQMSISMCNIYSTERIPDDNAVQTPSTPEMQTSSTVTKTLKARARIIALFRINSDVYNTSGVAHVVRREILDAYYERKIREKNCVQKIWHYFDRHRVKPRSPS